ncbi:MAG: hypothetical protein ACLQBD_00035 [Syntrophobacteraceae bacterium]
MCVKVPAKCAFILCTLLISAYAVDAVACECLSQSLQEDFKSAKNVFVGRLVSASAKPIYSEEQKGEDIYIEVTFQIEESFKGNPIENTVLYHAGNCAPSTVIWEYYVVFAAENGTASRCTRTRMIESVPYGNDELVKKLRELVESENKAMSGNEKAGTN